MQVFILNNRLLISETDISAYKNSIIVKFLLKECTSPEILYIIKELEL